MSESTQKPNTTWSAPAQILGAAFQARLREILNYICAKVNQQNPYPELTAPESGVARQA